MRGVTTGSASGIPQVTSLRPIAVAAYGPTILSSVGTGAVLPVLALTARDLGASVGTAAVVVALLGVGMLAGDLPAGAVFGLARHAYLAEAVAPTLRARALSTLGGVHRVGIFVGPFVGALTLGWWGSVGPYAVGVLAALAAAVLVAVTPDLALRDAARRADRIGRVERLSQAGQEGRAGQEGQPSQAAEAGPANQPGSVGDQGGAQRHRPAVG